MREDLDLYPSIVSDSIILYGKFHGKVRGNQYYIIVIEKIGKNRGALLNKLYGIKGKKGLIEKLGGFKLGKSCFAIPLESFRYIKEVLKRYDTSFKVLLAEFL